MNFNLLCESFSTIAVGGCCILAFSSAFVSSANVALSDFYFADLVQLVKNPCNLCTKCPFKFFAGQEKLGACLCCAPAVHLK